MKHLKIMSVLMSAAMGMSMVMTPVSVLADETTEATETQTTEAAEEKEPEETKAPKATEAKETKETKETEKQEPAESKEEQPTETEKQEPAESKETESVETETKESEAVEEKTPESSDKKDAKNATNGGKCGKELGWSYIDGTGILVIDGSGAMYNYDNTQTSSYTPWHMHLDSIEQVIFTNKPTSIGNYAFAGCTKLKSIVIPDSVKSIGSYAFYGCRDLSVIEISKGVNSIGSFAFAKSGLNDISFVEGAKDKDKEGLTSIGSSAFSDCVNLGTVSLSSKVKTIGSYAFSGCTSLSSVSMQNKITSIGSYAFSDCSNLASISFPTSISSIKDHVFSHCTKLNSVKVPMNITSIGDYAFESCTGLTNIEFTYKFKTVGDNAFRGCSSLTAVKIDRNVFEKYEDQFTRANQYVVPIPIVYADKGDTTVVNGMTFKVTNAAKTGSGTVSLIAYDGSQANVTIPGAVWVKDCTYKVNKITATAFKNSTALVSVSIGLTSFKITSKKLKKIGSYAFSGDKLLKTIYIQKTTKLTKKGVKKSMKSSSIKTVKVKKVCKSRRCSSPALFYLHAF